ncbi:KGK domain-containing protein [Anabaena sp. AL09]|jgi:hypothetical protein|uniref:KGK domain-containing protein n=1 Tax=Anabaena sp. AL09 TaxID=1710891 RepID=UPI0026130CF2|nr:KGK domain-containing protein [Anabaena sp. AL09]
MSDKFIPLDCDDDVLLFDGNASTVRNFICLIENNFKEKLFLRFNSSTQNIGDILKCISLAAPGGTGSLGYFGLGEIKWESNREGVSCKLLRIGSQGWQSGKIRINIKISITSEKITSSNSNTTSFRDKTIIKVCLEFCPEEPEKPESPLDDLRKSLNNT